METLPEEEKRKFDEFKKKNPITAYKDEIFIFLIKNPRIADGTFESEKNLLAIKREELNKLGI